MKQIIFSLNPGIWEKYKGHREAIKDIAVAVATWNASIAPLDMDITIPNLLQRHGFYYEVKDKETVYVILSHKRKEVIEYGTLTRVILR